MVSTANLHPYTKEGGGGGKVDKADKGELVVKKKKKKLDYEVIQIHWSVDRCAVCDDDRDFDFDQLITCEGCAVTVHQSCYGGDAQQAEPGF